ncbi:MAG: hypothetical protein NT092_06080 [Bacteroidia bacterium]|nr:hypothetical protein [Bacteroidia bacterium]
MKKNKIEEPIGYSSFLKFMLARENRYQLLIFFAAYVVLYIILVNLYPYPAGISDSGSYVRAASENTPDTYRPFGYSKFLIMVHGISSSIHFLVFIQFFINVLCTLFLLFTIKYFFPIKRKFIFYSFAFLAIVSPFTLYLSNSVLSDSLFTSLTMIWIGTGLWMLYSIKIPDKFVSFIIHALLLYCLISIRYTGLIYLAVSLVFVLVSFDRKKIWQPISLVIILLLMVFGIYRSQKSKTFRLVHVGTFSGFSGWQKASNAMNCVPYIDINPAKIHDKKVKEFTRFALQFDTLLITATRPTARYMWDNRLPLKSYCFYEAQRTGTPFIYQWNYLGANVYGKFGSFIMKKYPFAFARYYFLPNCRLIFYPTDDQVLKVFRTDWIPEDLLKSWFNFNPGEKLYSKSKVYEKTFFLIPLIRSVLWAILMACIIMIFMKRKQIFSSPCQTKSVFMLLTFILIYYAFSAYAGPFELRYIGPVHLSLISLIYISMNEIEFNPKIKE